MIQGKKSRNESCVFLVWSQCRSLARFKSTNPLQENQCGVNPVSSESDPNVDHYAGLNQSIHWRKTNVARNMNENILTIFSAQIVSMSLPLLSTLLWGSISLPIKPYEEQSSHTIIWSKWDQLLGEKLMFLKKFQMATGLPYSNQIRAPHFQSKFIRTAFKGRQNESDNDNVEVTNYTFHTFRKTKYLRKNSIQGSRADHWI